MFLNGNKLRHISENAFVGIKLQTLVLDNNEIEAMDEQAFNGSENSLVFLDIAGNNLTTLPEALTNLQNLMSLSVSSNPLPNLDQKVIMILSKSLIFIDFGSRELQEWPTSMKYLTKLVSLDISDVTFTSLPDDAFDSFSDTLQVLGIHNTYITRLPSSIAKLQNLQNLKFEGNQQLSVEAISKSIPNSLPGLIEVTFHNNGLTTLPDIFLNASHLYIVTVLDEPLKSLNDNLFSTNFSDNFHVVMMNNTNLTHVPACISKVNTIKRLQITHSQISSIDENDFHGMANLSILDLSDNPLFNISDKTFSRNSDLTYLILENTELTRIPRSIQNLHSPQLLNLSGCPIYCSCDNLQWIKSWKSRPKYFQIVGNCSNIKMDLMSYIQNEIPKCLS